MYVKNGFKCILAILLVSKTCNILIPFKKPMNNMI